MKKARIVRHQALTPAKSGRVPMRWSPEALEAREGAREEERQRLARELHDELGQALTSMKMELSWLDQHATSDVKPDAGAVKERIQVLRHLVEQATRTMRNVVAELRPDALDRLGLIAALEWQAERFARQAGLRGRFHSSSDSVELDRGRATDVFRVFQEILTNVARHAAASRVDVFVEHDADSLTLTVHANGRGFEPGVSAAPSAFGLLGIRERTLLLDGEFAINSAPRRGTRAVVKIPLANRRISPREAS